MTKPPPELSEFLFRYATAVQSLALGLRKVIHADMAPCHEYIFEMRSKVVLIYSSTDRVIADGICLISVLPRHVTLGFLRGVDLDDPTGMLKGAGKAMRHIQLTSLADLDQPEIRAYLRQARKNAGIKRSRQAAEAVTTRAKPRLAAKRSAWPQLF